jgi:tripartite-type tricarboxylate transporter receptor subunit TctC
MPGTVRAIVAFLIALATVLAIAATALAWPDRPLRIVVGFQAGGSSDVVTRLAAERLRGQLGGATIIIENRPGAAGSIAADAVLSAHDGHSLLTFSDSFVTSPLTNKSVRYQSLRDFKMISLMCEGTLALLAAPSAPFRDFKEFVAFARANPGKVTYVSAGIGGHQHLTGEYISAALKLDLTHVPTRGGSQATNDLVGGQVDAAILGLGPTLPHIRSGKLRALAVTVGQRVPQLPDVPTLVELGVGDFTADQWFGLAAPADTPDMIVDKVAQAMAAALDDEALRQRYDELGFVAKSSTPAAFTEKVRSQEALWRKLIADRGLKIE